jgi:hypothetical protein
LKIQVRSLAVALAIAVPMAVATAKSSAAPINGSSVKAAVPAVTTDVRYRVRRGHPYPPYWDYPAYNSYYPPYNPYSGYPTYNAIPPITIPASLMAGGDAKAWQRAAPSSAVSQHVFERF